MCPPFFYNVDVRQGATEWRFCGYVYYIVCSQPQNRGAVRLWITRADRREPRESRSKKRIELRSGDVVFTTFQPLYYLPSPPGHSLRMSIRQHRSSAAPLFGWVLYAPGSVAPLKLRSLGGDVVQTTFPPLSPPPAHPLPNRIKTTSQLRSSILFS